MERSIRPNTLCWCGSKKKYKDCHENRSRQEQPTIDEFFKLAENQFQIKYCSHPETSEKNCRQISNAHSISKVRGLKPISRDNHIYSFIPSQAKISHAAGALIPPSLIGVNKASTFPGFCSHHDSITFKPIDTQEFNVSSPHVFLLSYRSVCRELYAKEAHLDGLEKLRDFDAGQPFEGQVDFQNWIGETKEYANKGLAEIKSLKQLYDSKLKEESYNSLNYYSICFKGVLPIVCSGTGEFLYDAFKDTLQDLDDISVDTESTSFHIIPVRDCTVAVFAALGKCHVWKRLIDSLERVENTKVGDFLIKLAFFNFENLYASPVWWDSLSSDVQNYLLKLMRMMGDPNTPVEPPNISDGFNLKVQCSLISRSIFYAK
jgi:hypothetical protein